MGGVLGTAAGWAVTLRHLPEAFPEAFPAAFALDAVTLHLAANPATSARVVRERGLEPSPRWDQLGLVWLLPLVGVLVAYAFYRLRDDPFGHDGYDSSRSSIEDASM